MTGETLLTVEPTRIALHEHADGVDRMIETTDVRLHLEAPAAEAALELAVDMEGDLTITVSLAEADIRAVADAVTRLPHSSV